MVALQLLSLELVNHRLALDGWLVRVYDFLQQILDLIIDVLIINIGAHFVRFPEGVKLLTRDLSVSICIHLAEERQNAVHFVLAAHTMELCLDLVLGQTAIAIDVNDVEAPVDQILQLWRHASALVAFLPTTISGVEFCAHNVKLLDTYY